MKMHKPITALLSVALLAFFLTTSGCSPYKKDFYFNGEMYSHVKKMSGGEITNHFYTANGEDMNTADNFVQILEFSDKINQSDWSQYLQPIFRQYNLTPVDGQEFEMTGLMSQSGLYFRAYGAPIVVKEKDGMAFFITVTDKETYEKAKNSGDNAEDFSIIEELREIELG